MTVSREKYTELLDQFRVISEPYMSYEVIQRLKEENKKIINSARVLEKIKDIKSLLCVLEKRGIVQYNDISALKHIAKEFVRDRTVKELISNYEKWLEANSANVNYLYSCGKSHTLLNQNDINKFEISKAENCCDILKNVTNNESEENQINSQQYSEPLLPNEPCINIASTNFVQNINNFKTIINERNTPNRTKRGRIIIPLIITLILLILLICIIWLIVKMSYQSSAIIPKVDPSLQISMDPNWTRQQHYVSNVNVGVIRQTSFGINHTQNTATANAHVTPADVEKETQDLIIRTISKRIGKFWKDVCRNLKMQEGELLKIEFNHFRTPGTSSENMFQEALRIYFLDHHPNWRTDLLNALQNSHRSDLKDTVLEILSQKHFQ